MKLLTNIIPAVLIISAIVFAGCDSKRDPGKVYMPDMAYSRAYESFASRDSTKFTTDMYKKGGDMIFFNNMPASGTIKRGELFPYTIQYEAVDNWESHYLDETEESIVKHSDKYFTREIVEELAIDRCYYGTKLFRNLHKALFKN